MRRRPFVLRHAAISDLATIASWLRSPADCELWAGHRVTHPVDIEKLTGNLEWPIARSFSASAQGELIGFGQLVPKASGRFHLARVIVSPKHRGRGIGRDLVTLLLDAAQQFEPARLSLNVARDNPAALRLYASLGFTEVERPADEPESGACYMEHTAP